MLTIHTMTPFHHQYPKPQTVNTTKKDNSADKPASFHDILVQKMNEKNIPRATR
ncbi:hypothetical protein [Paenibacillus dakarensis]|uniref:hypothetical protein n=1 Tax=Paenibacillus dakarensis TaxID=1527293 RepID=UPI000B18288E|nr:hypothetical protein [Paenibacillus dakarensis]